LSANEKQTTEHWSNTKALPWKTLADMRNRPLQERNSLTSSAADVRNHTSQSVRFAITPFQESEDCKGTATAAHIDKFALW
jgi:hypothetical protein